MIKEIRAVVTFLLLLFLSLVDFQVNHKQKEKANDKAE